MIVRNGQSVYLFTMEPVKSTQFCFNIAIDGFPKFSISNNMPTFEKASVKFRFLDDVKDTLMFDIKTAFNIQFKSIKLTLDKIHEDVRVINKFRSFENFIAFVMRFCLYVGETKVFP